MDDHYPYIEPYAALTIAHSLLIQPYLLRKYVGYGLGNSLFKKYLDPTSFNPWDGKYYFITAANHTMWNPELRSWFTIPSNFSNKCHNP